MEQKERESIYQAAAELGAGWSSKLGKSNTHLILPTAGGPKYDHTFQLGIHAVTPDWLIESALAGGWPAGHDSIVRR